VQLDLAVCILYGHHRIFHIDEVILLQLEKRQPYFFSFEFVVVFDRYKISDFFFLSFVSAYILERTVQ